MAMKTRYTVVDGELLAERRTGVRRTYVPDAFGSTVALFDNGQQITDTFRYWPYGEEQSRTGTTLTALTFGGTLGYYHDLGTRVYVRVRSLDTVNACWREQAPSNTDPEGRSPDYVYAGSDPTSRVDPSGAGLPSNRLAVSHSPGGPLDHGNWCGAKLVGGSTQHKGNLPPCDCIDVGCKAHDLCLVPNVSMWKRRRCDLRLCQKAKACYRGGCKRSPSTPCPPCTASQGPLKINCRAFACIAIQTFCAGGPGSKPGIPFAPGFTTPVPARRGNRAILCSPI